MDKPTGNTTRAVVKYRMAETGDTSDEDNTNSNMQGVVQQLQVTELEVNTNLRTPPDNWLKGGFASEPWIPGGRGVDHSTPAFHSLVMGNTNLASVGRVDLMTRSQELKQLLKLPYDRAQSISMTVHRVGRTLFIDHFLYDQLLAGQQEDWKWLKQFVMSTVSEQQEATAKANITKKRTPTTKQDLEEKLMLSKFVYKSIEQLASGDSTAPDRDRVPSNNSSVACVLPFLCASSALLPDPLDSTTTAQAKQLHSCLPTTASSTTNTLWSIDDLQMLLGTDMPIFGCGKRPCVSLKLRDMKKPINVLTGLDYWLDQLMCHVPEVLMCYHLNGFVQKYEIIPTDDLPHLTEESKFDPELVNNVAQNILSFLKSNATKEGHTYWLYKEENDDFVKLYDLTSLCADYMDDTDANPFTLPVAILMYRVARNLMEIACGGEDTVALKRVANTVYRLLNNCLELLSRDKYPQVVGSVHHLLSNLYLIYGANANGPSFSTPNGDTDTTNDECWAMNESWMPTKGDLSSFVDVDQLMAKPKVSTSGKGASPVVANRQQLPNCTNVDDCCKQALEHVYEGLECTEVFERQSRTEDQSNSTDGTPPLGSETAIPLKYEPLSKKQASVLIPISVSRPLSSGWRSELIALLLTRAAAAYSLQADCSASLGHYGRALRQIRLGLACLDTVDQSTSEPPSATLRQCQAVCSGLLPSLLAKAGDVCVSLSGCTVAERRRHELGLNSQARHRDTTILVKAHAYRAAITPPKRTADGSVESAYSWATASVPEDHFGAQKLAERCYEAAFSVAQNNTTNVDGNTESTNEWLSGVSVRLDLVDLSRRLGAVKNELGKFHLELLQKYLIEGSVPEYGRRMLGLDVESDDETKEAKETRLLGTLAQRHFQDALKLFVRVQDHRNQSLIHSNLGKTFRLLVCTLAEGELSLKERHMMNNAIEQYEKAVACIGPNGGLLFERITADLAFVNFHYAVMLQERPPLTLYSNEQIEKEIAEYLNRALLGFKRLLRMAKPDDESNTPARMSRASLSAQCCCFQIYTKLASLQHNSFRRKAQKRDVGVKRMKALKDTIEFNYEEAIKAYLELVSHRPPTTPLDDSERCALASRSLEYLTLQLERIAFHEYVATDNTLVRSVVRACRECATDLHNLSKLISVHEPSASTARQPNVDAAEENDLGLDFSNSDGNSRTDVQSNREELFKLAPILLARIQDGAKMALQSFVKKESKKSRSGSKESAVWRQIYSRSLRLQSDNITEASEFALKLAELCKFIAETAPND